MKKLLLCSFLLSLFFCTSINAQTNISGIIAANTTWTLAGSPYIIVDTTIVFPGFTLTIDPGVTVKFNNGKYLEMRQSSLIADGTITDSIYFTSNSASPSPGNWYRISIDGGSMVSHFNYCNFSYANTGVYGGPISYIKNSNFIHCYSGLHSSSWNCLIDSCRFISNTISGVGGFASIINFCNISYNRWGSNGTQFMEMKNCNVTNNDTGIVGLRSFIHDCIISNNQTGINGQPGAHKSIQFCVIDSNTFIGIDGTDSYGDSIMNCEVKYNGTGMDLASDPGNPSTIMYCLIDSNTTGIVLRSTIARIMCNRICNNSTFDLQYTVGGNNTNVANNYWCTSDSTSTAARIFDGYDNLSLGIVSFMPIDTQQCYLSAGTLSLNNAYTSFNLYPNPASDVITITNRDPIRNVYIYSIDGRLIQTFFIGNSFSSEINTGELKKGIYFLSIESDTGKITRKFIKQ